MNPPTLDPVTRAVLANIADAVYAVAIDQDQEGLVATAVSRDRERFLVHAGTPYDAVVELAGQVRVDLIDS